MLITVKKARDNGGSFTNLKMIEINPINNNNTERIIPIDFAINITFLLPKTSILYFLRVSKIKINAPKNAIAVLKISLNPFFPP